MGLVLSRLQKSWCRNNFLAQAPENILAWCKKGLGLKKAERCEEALSSFEKVLAMEARNIDYLGGKKECLVETGESYTRALTLEQKKREKG